MVARARGGTGIRAACSRGEYAEPEHDGARRDRANFQQKIMRDRFRIHNTMLRWRNW